MAEAFDVGTLLRRLRDERKMLQADLAKGAGLDVSAISHFESGRRVPNPETAETLSETLGLTGEEHRRFIELARETRMLRKEAIDRDRKLKRVRQPGVARNRRRESDFSLLHVDPVVAATLLDSEETTEYSPPRLRQESISRLVRRYGEGVNLRTTQKLGGKILERHYKGTTITYPVVVFPAREAGQALETVLPARRVDARQSSAAQADSLAFCDPYPRLQRWLAANPTGTAADALERTSQGWNICMTTLTRQVDGELVMTARLAPYGVILDSCDALLDETFLGDPDVLWPRRDALEGKENPLDAAMHRAAGTGVAALITVVEREPGGSYILNALIGRRSRAVGTYQDTWHVAPAGMLNWRFGGAEPNGDDEVPSGSYDPGDLLRSVLTEYAEETRNMDELEANTNRAFLARVPAVKDLVGVARFEFTGIAMDLANLRPEICVLIYIGDPAWYDDQEFSLNYEYVGADEPVGRPRLPGEKRRLTPITVARDGRPLDSAYETLRPESTVAAGAAAFWLGVDRARQIFRDELASRVNDSKSGVESAALPGETTN